MEIQALKQQITSLTEEADIYKAKLMVMNRRTRQRRLGEELRIKFLEKKEELERELIEANINLRYLIEENRRLEFRDNLREKLMFGNIPYKSEDLGNEGDRSGQFSQNQAVSFDEVNRYLHVNLKSLLLLLKTSYRFRNQCRNHGGARRAGTPPIISC